MDLTDKYISKALHEITLAKGDLGVKFKTDNSEELDDCIYFLVTEIAKNRAEIMKLKEKKRR